MLIITTTSKMNLLPKLPSMTYKFAHKKYKMLDEG